jgi:5-methylcytosine-specific restriction endonuclease McrA
MPRPEIKPPPTELQRKMQSEADKLKNWDFKKDGWRGKRKKKKKGKKKHDGFEFKNPFYKSPAWKKVRYLAIKTYGRRCFACGATDGQMHVDHIKPRSRFPQLATCLTNLQILCADCNMGKGSWDDTDWRPKDTASVPDVTPAH